jgi:non-ribosomal peptide synthetase component E (peptide arylation enzyme)
MLPGETIATGAPSTCADCLKDLKNEVLRSAAGYYIGTLCDCGPYTRESGYYRTEEEAQRALDAGTFVRF